MTGIVVVELNSDGQAAKVGIRMHDLLYKYNDLPLNSTEELISATRAGNSNNQIQVIRGRELLNFNIGSGSLGVSILPYPVQDMHLDGVGEVLANIKNSEVQQQQTLDAEILSRISKFPVTTTPQLEGYRVTQMLGIITAEYVGGINMFRDLLAGVRDIVGGRSGTLQDELRVARETCIASLKTEAYNLGANAVVGVALDYSEISGGGKSMLFLVASGTAVNVEKLLA